MNRHHRIDGLLGEGLSKRDRENVALAVLATACITGIVLLNRVG